MDLTCDDEHLSPAQTIYQLSRRKEFQQKLLQLEAKLKQGSKLTTGVDGKLLMVPEAKSLVLPESDILKSNQNGSLVETHRLRNDLNGVQGRCHPGPLQNISSASGPGQLIKVTNRTIAPNGFQPPRLSIGRMGNAKPTPIFLEGQRPPNLENSERDLKSRHGVSNNLNDYPALKVMVKIIRGEVSNVENISKKAELDAKLKTLLSFSQARLTEWLLEKGLVQNEQTHGLEKLSLGFFSDQKKYPMSGGYIWFLKDNPTVKVSVFKDSIFEQSNFNPFEILKLMYHWCQQSNPEKVLAWMKTSLETLNSMYCLFRSACKATVEEELQEFKGFVEVCLVPFMVPSDPFENRSDILGVLSSENPDVVRYFLINTPRKASLRLRTDLVVKILEGKILRGSILMMGSDLDSNSMKSLGLNIVTESYDQLKVYNYLKQFLKDDVKVKLSPLKSNDFQQFLDEITFRDLSGHSEIECFNKLITSISKQTQNARKNSKSGLNFLFDFAQTPTVDVPQSLSVINPQNPTVAPKRSNPSVQNDVQLKKLKTDFNGKSVKKKIESPNVTNNVELEVKNAQLEEKRGILQLFYYGSCDGDPEILQNEFKSEMAFKCPCCRIVCMSNLDFMKHISGHAQMPTASARDLIDLMQCNYCLKSFESEDQLQSHLDATHFLSNQQFVCKICCKEFPFKENLEAHMVSLHVGAEAPFICSSCGFRAYSHMRLLDHFFEAHNLTDALMCTFCLKTFLAFSEKKNFQSNVATAYFQHVQKHYQIQRINCTKCCLDFLTEHALRDHFSKDHLSCISDKNFRFYNEEGDNELISLTDPGMGAIKIPPKTSAPPKRQANQIAFPMKNLDDLKIYGLSKDDVCVECCKKLSSPGHSVGFLGCTKCVYSTCCWKTMNTHVMLFHGPKGVLNYLIAPPIVLEKDLTCKCGFSTKFGNAYATHLANHLKNGGILRNDATDLVHQDEDPSVIMAKAYCKPVEQTTVLPEGPLAFLGLQPTSSDPSLEDGKSVPSKTQQSLHESPSENF